MSADDRADLLRAKLAKRTGTSPDAVRVVVSPYRICPLGAHSDHQHGPVLGMAIDAYTHLAFVPGEALQLEIESADFDPPAAFSIGKGAPVPSSLWHRYAFGAAQVLAERVDGPPRGFRACMEGTLPGGGLSSSASAVIAYLLAFARVNDLDVGETELVRAAVRVENEFAGVACGALDPACIAGSRRDHLLAIETSSLGWEPVRLGGESAARFLVVSTARPRSLSATPFNVRVEECHAAARALGRASGRALERLGDADREIFDSFGSTLPAVLQRRARHFYSERDRVRSGLECWRRGDLAGFGARMNASCESSIHDYETGSPELVSLQRVLLDTPGVLGARFSGGGFGGCSVALVSAEGEAEAIAHLERVLPRTLGEDARILPVASADAARVL